MAEKENIWRSIERDFKAIRDNSLFPLQADCQETTPDPGGVSGFRLRPDNETAEHFKAIAVLAGQELVNDISLRSFLPEKAVLEPDPFNRWLITMRAKVTNAYRFLRTVWGADEDGNKVETSNLGIMENIIQNSIVLCLKLAAKSKIPSGNVENQKGPKQEAKIKLPPKKQDLSRYFNGLTERQESVASLVLEYGLSKTEVARMLDISRKTVYGHLAAATRNIERSRMREHSQKSGAKKLLSREF